MLTCFSRVWLFGTHGQAPLWIFPSETTGVGCHFLLQYDYRATLSLAMGPCRLAWPCKKAYCPCPHSLFRPGILLLLPCHACGSGILSKFSSDLVCIETPGSHLPPGVSPPSWWYCWRTDLRASVLSGIWPQVVRRVGSWGWAPLCFPIICCPKSILPFLISPLRQWAQSLPLNSMNLENREKTGREKRRLLSQISYRQNWKKKKKTATKE